MTYTLPEAPALPGTPEELFIVHPGYPRDVRALPYDALQCAVARAQAVLAFMERDAQDTEQGFTLSPDLVANGLWALDGLLDQMRKILDHAAPLPAEAQP